MNLSFSDYQNGLSNGLYAPPSAYRPFMSINRSQYKALEEIHKNNKNDVYGAFRSIRQRVGHDYFTRMYPLQCQTLDYSQMSFPAYRFIMPEVLTDDWLAIVDWHKKFKRDHVVHQPLTAYIVLKLLTGGGDSNNAFYINGSSLLDLCIDEILKWDATRYLKEYLLNTRVSETDIWLDGSILGRKFWKHLFVESAYLAAIFHDMGYPWQYVNLLSNNLDCAGYQSDTPNTSTTKLIETLGERLIFCPLNGYRFLDRNTPGTWHQRLSNITEKALRKTHGFPGAIGFLYLNDVLRVYPDEHIHPIKQFCVEWASMAIMMHDMPKIYWGETNAVPENPHMQLKFDVDPLSCIIALADELEDFCRPVANFQDIDQDVRVSYPIACDSTVIEIDDNTLKIIYGFKDNTKRMEKLIRLPKEHKEYFDQQYGFLDLSSIGISRVEMETQSV